VSARITIITPSFNQGRYLEETILSVINQQYGNLEYIIIDGGSTDQSASIIDKYSSRLSYSLIEKDSGQSEAINKGFAKTTGDIVSWLGSDDLLADGALTKVATAFERLPSTTGLVHGNTELFSESGFSRIDKGYPDQSVERRLAGMTFPQPSSFIKRTFLDKTGFLNNDYHYVMDYDLFSRLAMTCKFEYIDELLSKYRLHDMSKSQTALQGFAGDWMKIFNGVIRGLGFDNAVQELEQLGLSTGAAEGAAFFVPYRNKIAVNEKLLRYYFFSNVLKYDYESGNFSRAKEIASHLSTNYFTEASGDPDVKQMISRLKYLPGSVISLIRKLTRTSK